MPLTRTHVAAFAAGAAVGAMACVTYPRWKDKVRPALLAALAGASDAIQAANAAMTDTPVTAGDDPVVNPFVAEAARSSATSHVAPSAA